MELKDRIALILEEKRFKQKDLADIMGVTSSYVSCIVSGRNIKLSTAVVNLIEEKLGYRAQWILTGEGEKLRHISKRPNLSDAHKRAIMQMEKMPIEQVKAVLVFIESLEKIESAFKEKGG